MMDDAEEYPVGRTGIEGLKFDDLRFNNDQIKAMSTHARRAADEISRRGLAKAILMDRTSLPETARCCVLGAFGITEPTISREFISAALTVGGFAYPMVESLPIVRAFAYWLLKRFKYTGHGSFLPSYRDPDVMEMIYYWSDSRSRDDTVYELNLFSAYLSVIASTGMTFLEGVDPEVIKRILPGIPGA